MEQSNLHSKKRKIFHAEDDDDDDEEKIEKFFALIKTMREARDRLLTERGVTMGGSKRFKIEATRKPMPVSGWKPAFKLEDFTHDTQRISAHDSPTNDSDTRRRVGSEPESDHREMKVSLDLTLSL